MAYICIEVGDRMIKLSELQLKEVIVVQGGRRLGYIYDLEINSSTGYIEAVIITNKNKQHIFGKAEEYIIDWKQIVTIGLDVILVQYDDGEV